MRDLVTGPRIVVLIASVDHARVVGANLATFVLAAAAAHVHISIPGNLAALLAVNVSLIVRATLR